jgi:hypothetical protein
MIQDAIGLASTVPGLYRTLQIELFLWLLWYRPGLSRAVQVTQSLLIGADNLFNQQNKQLFPLLFRVAMNVHRKHPNLSLPSTFSHLAKRLVQPIAPVFRPTKFYRRLGR